MSDAANGDRVSSIPESPRVAFPTLPELGEDATCEERVIAYANLCASYHQICKGLEWQLERANAERSMLRHEVEAIKIEMRGAIAELGERLGSIEQSLQTMTRLIGAAK